MPKYLGIDYGSKRVGIAVSDPGLSIAFARRHLLNDPGLMKKIEATVREDEISEIVIGLPVSLSGEETPQTAETKRFAEKLDGHLRSAGLNVKLEFIDERLTSRMAGAGVLEAVVRKGKRRDKGLVDELSAQIILQNYLDMKKNQII
ncbi:MAG: Holliday junction resolvase RuvX [Ignavibacteria bacterium]|nr:Holliday junction resolvase RuvX [Ignavibacteria bacterium]